MRWDGTGWGGRIRTALIPIPMLSFGMLLSEIFGFVFVFVFVFILRVRTWILDCLEWMVGLGGWM